MVPFHGKETTFVEIDIHPSLLTYCLEELDCCHSFLKRMSKKEDIVCKSEPEEGKCKFLRCRFAIPVMRKNFIDIGAFLEDNLHPFGFCVTFVPVPKKFIHDPHHQNCCQGVSLKYSTFCESAQAFKIYCRSLMEINDDFC